jgi:predicted NBD/HSP70 family sugar kinase
MDSGIGGALVDRGRVTTGAHGMAGEFGHMPFGSRRSRCRCGARGCWNTELDGAALARVLGRPAPVDEVSFSRAVLAAARAGKEPELRAVGRAASALGRGAAGLVNAADPDLVVLSGLAAEMLDASGRRLRRAYLDGLMQTLANRPPQLVAGALGDRGPLVGAAEAAFSSVLAHPPA